ncbi:nucleotidyltransferase domain-containing protein [Roseivirga sp. E12]|uniref:nucleotidyltransferase domain-containing protein n=1 Tax=Roseivirga sp. E12 TaxID=2819237 RepID=UPI001ABBE345|nr:nucleotidyltransferase domain-containing protein [Roseivirga sp. E12]MBO3696901.1 nucleotidyltransferase domain-containing protein [Roseivirga sp. E12]
MIQREFALNAQKALQEDEDVIGLAVAGSWLTNELDEYSDLDLILVTQHRLSDDKSKMLEYATRLGKLLNGFTGEHVGEPRVLICLYDEPLLHVDIKFLTLEEFGPRVEDPILMIDRDGQLSSIMSETKAEFPYPDYQWIEDRFWTWIHYALLKIGRGEHTEAFDFSAFMRMVVFGPLLHIKNSNQPRGVRKAETTLSTEDFDKLKATLPTYDKASLLSSLRNSVKLYKQLQRSLFGSDIRLATMTEESVMKYFDQIESK